MKEALVDTDILSYYLKGDEVVVEAFKKYFQYFTTINISYITYFEIIKGLEYKQARKQIVRFESFVENCNLINISKKSLQISAKIDGDLKRKGKQIGIADILIAGITIVNEYQLISNNTKHYENIEKLDLGNWKNLK